MRYVYDIYWELFVSAIEMMIAGKRNNLLWHRDGSAYIEAGSNAWDL